MKKKWICFAMALSLAFAFAACGSAGSSGDAASGEASSVTVDYGTSDLYTRADMDEAVALINEEFAGWEGCEMHSIRYAGDEADTAENVEWLTELGNGEAYTECMEFLTDFHSPVEAYGAWEPDMEYEDYQWWLARTDGGDWELLSWGY